MELLEHFRSELGSAKFEALEYDELKLNKKCNTLDLIQVSTRRIRKPLYHLRLRKLRKVKFRFIMILMTTMRCSII